MTPIWVMLLAMRYLLRSKSCWKPSARSEAASPYRDLMLAVRADEARWCAMLSGQIKRLGGTPSRKTGGFYAKALAISGALDRLAFLNRGQGWIVRKLEALTPRIRDEVLYADLRAILDSHRTNIDRACALLDLRPDSGQDCPPEMRRGPCAHAARHSSP